MRPEVLLEEAATLISNRAEQRDRPSGEKSMAATILAFNAITGHKLTEREGWLLMVLLKSVRSSYGKYVKDDYADMAAYVALMHESAHAIELNKQAIHMTENEAV